jgi:hypothetical protein
LLRPRIKEYDLVRVADDAPSQGGVNEAMVMGHKVITVASSNSNGEDNIHLCGFGATYEMDGFDKHIYDKYYFLYKYE